MPLSNLDQEELFIKVQQAYFHFASLMSAADLVTTDSINDATILLENPFTNYRINLT